MRIAERNSLHGVNRRTSGGVFVITRSLSSGDMSMNGILDRLRLSYPDRSGKEADQVLSVLNLSVIIIGGIIVTVGVILHPKTTIAVTSSIQE